MKQIRIVYFGASNYSLYFLKNLKRQNIDIAGICSIKKNKGFLPLISNVPKDHHSLLQLYLDGPKDKIFYIFSV